jgi:hypothetical protein
VIHHHIDLGSVLRGTVCALYSNLVTRPTGAAVRTEIERAIAELGGRSITVIDFSQVTLLDFSCADEIVAKLQLAACADELAAAVVDATVAAPRTVDGYFLFLGLGERHLDAVEAVLERHRLAIVAVLDGAPALVGDVDAPSRAVWETLRDAGPSDARSLARLLDATEAEMTDALDALARRRLVVRVGATYAIVGAFGPSPAPEVAA